MKVELKGIHKSFKSRERILHLVSATFLPGEVSVIVGRSGSGKSTLLKCICGVETPDKGKIYYDSRNITDLDANNRATFRIQTIGFVYQFFHLIPSLTVHENIKLPIQLSGKKSPHSVRSLSDMFGISHLLNEWPETLSGGESQRVALCRALITDPSVLLADEPTGNLDQKNRDDVMNHLKKMAHSFNKTVIIVTHDAAFFSIADQVYDLQAGQLSLK
ncbi:MAG: ABC transporter ATP-binding protein [bacterium]